VYQPLNSPPNYNCKCGKGDLYQTCVPVSGYAMYYISTLHGTASGTAPDPAYTANQVVTGTNLVPPALGSEICDSTSVSTPCIAKFLYDGASIVSLVFQSTVAVDPTQALSSYGASLGSGGFFGLASPFYTGFSDVTLVGPTALVVGVYYTVSLQTTLSTALSVVTLSQCSAVVTDTNSCVEVARSVSLNIGVQSTYNLLVTNPLSSYPFTAPYWTTASQADVVVSSFSSASCTGTPALAGVLSDACIAAAGSATGSVSVTCTHGGYSNAVVRVYSDANCATLSSTQYFDSGSVCVSDPLAFWTGSLQYSCLWSGVAASGPALLESYLTLAMSSGTLTHPVFSLPDPSGQFCITGLASFHSYSLGCTSPGYTDALLSVYTGTTCGTLLSQISVHAGTQFSSYQLTGNFQCVWAGVAATQATPTTAPATTPPASTAQATTAPATTAQASTAVATDAPTTAALATTQAPTAQTTAGPSGTGAQTTQASTTAAQTTLADANQTISTTHSPTNAPTVAATTPALPSTVALQVAHTRRIFFDTFSLLLFVLCVCSRDQRPGFFFVRVRREHVDRGCGDSGRGPRRFYGYFGFCLRRSALSCEARKADCGRDKRHTAPCRP